MVKKSKKQKQYLFLDTNFFLNFLFNEIENSWLENFSKHLKKENIIVLLPENIKREIEYELYENSFLTRNTQFQEVFKKIMALGEADTKKTDVQTSEVVSKNFASALLAFQDDIFKKVNESCEKRQKKFDKFCKDINPEIIDIKENILVNGIKRSLMKKAPFTNKSKEAHRLKDSDCIAFAAILHFLEKENKSASLKPSVIMCVSDIDYKDKNGLHFDIKESLKDFNLKHCNDLSDLFKFLKIKDLKPKTNGNVSKGENQDVLSQSVGENKLESSQASCA
jgi:hypothetical protein